MSSYQFLAADQPISGKANPYIQHLSINEALAVEMDLPDFLLENPDIDRDEPLIMVCDSEAHLEELEITPVKDVPSSVKHYTAKPFVLELKWKYTDERAAELIGYLRDQLAGTAQIEIWSIWLDETVQAAVHPVIASDLQIADLKFLDLGQGSRLPEGLSISR